MIVLVGSLLVACAHHKGYVMGSELDYLLLHGRGIPILSFYFSFFLLLHIIFFNSTFSYYLPNSIGNRNYMVHTLCLITSNLFSKNYSRMLKIDNNSVNYKYFKVDITHDIASSREIQSKRSEMANTRRECESQSAAVWSWSAVPGCDGGRCVSI